MDVTELDSPIQSSTTTNGRSQPTVGGDADFREKLAKSIGLDRAPEPDPAPLGRPAGLLSDGLPRL